MFRSGLLPRLKLLFLRAHPRYRSLRQSALFFLNGVPALPPPLKKEEEEGCIAAFARGDDAAGEKLITHNLRLVVYIAKKFENSAVGIDDLVSIGTIGLIKAVRSYCPEKNIKLATYASRCIENEILMFLRKASNKGTEISIDEPLNVDWDGNELLLSDILATGADSVSEGLEHNDEIRVLMRCISGLPERERKIVSMRFGLSGGREYTQKEVAECLGISQSYISRIEKKIIADLKRSLEKENSLN